MKTKTLYLFKPLTAFCALFGVLFSLFSAQRDGYSHWLKRLLYFTAQSNIWLGITFTALTVLPLFSAEKQARWTPHLYLLKYIFTVSITMTGLVFCGLLAPFSGDDYRPWTTCNVLTHVAAPLFAVVDFFLDEFPFPLGKKEILFSLLPPLCYFSVAGFLGVLGTDFGRGEPYPYFFMNFRSPAGIFGFSDTLPFILGSAYWLALFGLITYGIALLYARLSRQSTK